MHATLPLLKATDFPPLTRRALDTLQVNLGYKCNQACHHCHVNASPDRKEMMSRDTIDDVLRVLAAGGIGTLDVTGGAPELNPHFRHLVHEARGYGIRVIDRCNLTILNELGFEDLAEFLAREGVEITASLPCYTKDNVDRQRGDQVFDSSILALTKLNALGYGVDDSGLVLNLVYNPLGPSLPPAQDRLEAAYKRELAQNFGIVFNRLFTLANMPIARFGSTLITQGKFASYMALLHSAHNPDNLDGVMCRTLVSVDYRGYLYDCDFNQMLGIPMIVAGKARRHVTDLLRTTVDGAPIAVADHCYGCTAGQGSSCGGALA
ncbi:MAG: arsenosugar biosynthesis radical SAM (seleno)protein ArsS [Casimicrobiaceae bacterium]